MLKKLTIVLGMAVAVAGTTTVSSFVFVPEAQALGFKSIKKAAKKAGRKVKKGGKAVGRTAKKGGKAVGRTAKKGGKAVGRTAKRGGRAVKRNYKCMLMIEKVCGRIGPLPAGTKGNPRPAVRIHRSSARVTAHRG